jgi:hypothetical protein
MCLYINNDRDNPDWTDPEKVFKKSFSGGKMPDQW